MSKDNLSHAINKIWKEIDIRTVKLTRLMRRSNEWWVCLLCATISLNEGVGETASSHSTVSGGVGVDFRQNFDENVSTDKKKSKGHLEWVWCFWLMMLVVVMSEGVGACCRKQQTYTSWRDGDGRGYRKLYRK